MIRVARWILGVLIVLFLLFGVVIGMVVQNLSTR